MGSKIFTGKYDINSINIGSNRKLTLYSLMGILQDIASRHAFYLGYGYEDMKKLSLFWVLTAQKIKIYDWASWHQKLRVETWTTPIRKFYAFREYQFYIEDRVVGECSTKWLILDGKTRKPVRAEYINKDIPYRDDFNLDFSTEKLVLPDDMSFVREYSVYNSDLDMNGHVNNTKYCKWVLNSLPFHCFTEKIIKEFDIQFLNETFLGDKVELFRSKNEDIENSCESIYFKGVRGADKNSLFSSRLLFTTP
ncbi:MAG: acyl-[acyl-carrier-protein] thioesterase [Candidatus Cloacimonadota bacterium]|nr:MAG: acyl-[acyl-carrier-protein] thioesterase [Candidatus Cloacimonadota bacterium]PIE81767.1 MAG: acyl-[acyl-carrier-protein] thioesterase [Candidatus Delongbacteria bacterium]